MKQQQKSNTPPMEDFLVGRQGAGWEEGGLAVLTCHCHVQNMIDTPTEYNVGSIVLLSTNETFCLVYNV